MTERLQREQARADLGLPETVADEVHGDCRGCFPSVLGYRSYRELGRELLVHLWQHVEGKSPATRSRWQWTWVGPRARATIERQNWN